MTRLKNLSRRISDFAKARDWDQFHSPKNLSMALSVEAAELLEHFQWLTEEESLNLSSETRNKVESELADVFIYLVKLANRLDMDLYDAADHKIKINETKYPIDKAKGNARKYTDFD